MVPSACFVVCWPESWIGTFKQKLVRRNICAKCILRQKAYFEMIAGMRYVLNRLRGFCDYDINNSKFFYNSRKIIDGSKQCETEIIFLTFWKGIIYFNCAFIEIPYQIMFSPKKWKSNENHWAVCIVEWQHRHAQAINMYKHTTWPSHSSMVHKGEQFLNGSWKIIIGKDLLCVAKCDWLFLPVKCSVWIETRNRSHRHFNWRRGSIGGEFPLQGVDSLQFLPLSVKEREVVWFSQACFGTGLTSNFLWTWWSRHLRRFGI